MERRRRGMYPTSSRRGTCIAVALTLCGCSRTGFAPVFTDDRRTDPDLFVGGDTGGDLDLGADPGGDAGHDDATGDASATALRLVQEKGVGGGASSLSLTLDQPAAAGDFLIACISFDSLISDVTSVAGANVTWARVDLYGRTAVYAGFVMSGPASSVVVTFDRDDNVGLHISEWTNVRPGGAVDAYAQSLGTSGTIDTAVLAVASTHALVYACAADDLETIAAGPTGGFTALTSITTTSDKQHEAYLEVFSTGTRSTSWTLSGSDEWSAIIVGFVLP